jgi:Tol biopolymer transport system component
VTDGVISPDGKYLAFSDSRGFFLRQIDTGETHAVPLPKDFHAKPGCWFPDGVHMLATWVAGPQEAASIWQISVLGGTPRKLVEKGYAPAISPDGSQVVFLTGNSEATHGFLMKADGTGVRTIIPDDGQTFVGSPVWSPDGRRIAYARGSYSAGYARIEARIEILEVATGDTETVLTKPGLGSSVAWTPDGRLIYTQQEPLTSTEDANLWAIRVDGAGHPQGAALRLTHGLGYACIPSITADGKRLAYFRKAIEPDIYIVDLEANGAKLGEPRQITFDERSNRNGNFNVFEQNVNDTEPEILVSGPEDSTIPRLSPDGKTLLYLVPPKAGDPSVDVRLMKTPLGGGPPQTVLVMPEASNQQCARLPSTVCIISRIQSGRERFFYFDVDKGLGAEIKNAEVESSNSFDFNWSLSPDGTMLALARKEGFKDESSVILLSLKDGARNATRVPGDWLGIGSIDWAADGKSMWATAYAATGPRRLLNININGHVRPMLDEAKMKLGWAIPSPDGKHLALWKASGSSNVWMLENF